MNLQYIEEIDLEALVDFFGTLLDWKLDIINSGERNERKLHSNQ
jgi:hypothetical protein